MIRRPEAAPLVLRRYTRCKRSSQASTLAGAPVAALRATKIGVQRAFEMWPAKRNC